MASGSKSTPELLSELRAHLSDDDDRESATELIRRLRRRGDITESIGKEIDALLLSSPSEATVLSAPPVQRTSAATQATATGAPAAVQKGWYADPYRRYDQRYWDGTTWTNHVSRGGQQGLDAPAATQQQSIVSASVQPVTATAPVGKWDTGTFVTLLIVSIIPCIGIIGIIVGGINLNKPARRGQALALMTIGIAITVLMLANADFSSSDSGF